MTRDEPKRRVAEAVDRRAGEIIGVGERIGRHPELGFKALGATVEIDTLPGYLPLECDATMTRHFRDNAIALGGEVGHRGRGHRTGSTDMGDLSQIMPVLHPDMGGASGTGHGADCAIVDRTLACVAPAKALASMVIDMLGDGAAGAREVLARSRPRLQREAYLELQRGMARREIYDGAAG